MLLRRSAPKPKRLPRKLTPHPLPTAHQSPQLRKPLSLLMAPAKVQSHHMQHQNLPTHLQNQHIPLRSLPMHPHNQLIPLQNHPMPHQDLPTPPPSRPTTLLQNRRTPHQPRPTRPLPPTPPHSQSHTVPNLPTLPRVPPTVQPRPTPMRLLLSMSSTTTCQTALPLTGELLPPSLAPGRNAVATQPRAPTQSSCLTAELRSSPTLWPTMTAVLSLRCVMRARLSTPQNLPIVIPKVPLPTANLQFTQGRMARAHMPKTALKIAKVQTAI